MTKVVRTDNDHDFEIVSNGKGSVTDDEYSAESRSPLVEETNLCKRIVIFVVVFTVILGAVGGGLSVFFLGSSNPVEFFVQQDPPGRNETLAWRMPYNSMGLELVIVNALEDSWTPILSEFVEQWDAGYEGVDPLTLSVQRVEPDPNCNPSPGRLKVCNGDYGPTDWRGINIVLLQNEYIAHSVAKMNDYWLRQEGEVQMRYTMCHELGHGFGLAHTDEDYFNLNTGECMDYTTRPRMNLNPGKFNFDLLAELYGNTISGNSIQNESSEPAIQSPWNRRTLMLSGCQMPEIIAQKYFRAVKQMESMPCVDCVVELEDGYRVEVHQLHVI